jgi:uncharacterized iron-regulated protein
MRFWSCLAPLLTVLGACVPGGSGLVDPSVRPGPPWASAFALDHPLAGRIWQPAENRFADSETVVAALRNAPFVLLGEKHDNEDHHRVQTWLLSRLMADGRRPAVAFEMLSTDQEDALGGYLAERPGDAAGLGEAVGWAQTGWPDWSMYQPIAQAALDGGAPLLAASLPRRTIRAVAKDGPEVLGAAQVATLGLGHPLPPEKAASLRVEIIETHCNQLPDSMVDPMVMITAVKDAQMAATLARGAAMPGRDGAVLVGGSGHVRADRGVPWYLQRVAPDRRAVTVGLVEVEPGEMDPAAYAARFHGTALPFDFVWFTPRADEEDPCQAYAEQLQRAKERHLKKQAE